MAISKAKPPNIPVKVAAMRAVAMELPNCSRIVLTSLTGIAGAIALIIVVCGGGLIFLKTHGNGFSARALSNAYLIKNSESPVRMRRHLNDGDLQAMTEKAAGRFQAQ